MNKMNQDEPFKINQGRKMKIQKDNTQDSEGLHPNFNELKTDMNKYELLKIY